MYTLSRIYLIEIILVSQFRLFVAVKRDVWLLDILVHIRIDSKIINFFLFDSQFSIFSIALQDILLMIKHI